MKRLLAWLHRLAAPKPKPPRRHTQRRRSSSDSSTWDWFGSDD